MSQAQVTIDLDDSTDRYVRQNPLWSQSVLKTARVLVAGAGTLGNEVIKNLALLGVGHITIVDLDNVELLNLNRSVLFRDDDIGKAKALVAAKRVREINPDVEAVGIKANVVWDLGMGYVRRFDMVVGALDNREARVWLNRAAFAFRKPYVDGAVEALIGEVQVITPPTSFCYECSFTPEDYNLLHLRYPCPGAPLFQLIEGSVPMVCTSASATAAVQVHQVLCLLHKSTDMGNPGRRIRLNLGTNSLEVLEPAVKEGCLGHWDFPEESCVEMECNRDVAVTQFIDSASRFLSDSGVGNVSFKVDWEYTVSATCSGPNCRHTFSFYRPLRRLGPADVSCPKCGHPLLFSGRSVLEKLEVSLAQIGVAPYEVFRVMVDGGQVRSLLIQPPSKEVAP